MPKLQCLVNLFKVKKKKKEVFVALIKSWLLACTGNSFTIQLHSWRSVSSSFTNYSWADLSRTHFHYNKQVAFSYCVKITMGSLLKISRSLWDLLKINQQATLQFAKQHIYLIRQEPFNQYSWVGSKWRTLPIWILTLMQYLGLSAYPKWHLKNCWAWGSWRTAMGRRERRQCWSAAAYPDINCELQLMILREELFVNTPIYLSLARAAVRKLGRLITAWLEKNFLSKWYFFGKSLENTWSCLEVSISNITSGWLEDISLSCVKASEWACVLVCIWRINVCTCGAFFSVFLNSEVYSSVILRPPCTLVMHS